MHKYPFGIALLLSLGLCTACSVPEPETGEGLEPMPTAVLSDTRTEEETTETTTISAATVPVNHTESTDISDENQQVDASETTDNTEETSEEVKHYPWQDAYASVLSARVKAAGYQNAYFALVSLDNDNIPELVVLVDTYTELYCFDGTKAFLLLEDTYKNNTFEGNSVCYQPGTGLFSIRFSTMGGGSGFVIFEYMQMDRVHVNHYRFNVEDLGKDDEPPYGDVWENAERLNVLYEDGTLSLGSNWTKINTDFNGLTELTAQNAAHVGEEWQAEISIDATDDEIEALS